ncbi:MAG: hypothetical protein HYX37_09380 [Rhizobiales bacterium]|nr:hypothetical protein [Hyphomicrobiales bacterium]
MRNFSPKIILMVFAAVTLVALLIWHFFVTHKSVDDLIPNIISDIVFAVFVVVFIEYANKKDREQRNRARRRAAARATQKFYQNFVQIIGAFISDGVISSKATSLPTRKMVEERAKKQNATTSLSAESLDQPIPYGAFFICDFTGTTQADVFPARPVREWISQLANQQEQLYRDVFHFDSGFLPDEIVDSLTELKDQSLFVFGRTILFTPGVRIGYWTEEELVKTISHLGKVQSYFAAEIGYSESRPDEVVKNAVQNALNKVAVHKSE